MLAGGTKPNSMTDAPEFVLLDAVGPRPGALLVSFSLLSALLASAMVLARAPGPNSLQLEPIQANASQ